MDGLSRREFHRLLVSAAAIGPLGFWPRAAFADAADDFGYVHPELRPIVKPLLQAVAAMPELSAETLALARKAMGRWSQPVLDHLATAKRTVKGLPGNPDVDVHVVNSDPARRRPAILHTHGGGFVTGRAVDMLADLQRLALEIDCTIVTVEYRLAPETDFRGSVSDNYAALQWLHDEAGALGVDPARIAVMGESAGGGHAALLALKARDLGKIPLAAQILVYPMLDDRTGVTHTPPPPIGTLLWTAPKNRFGWQSFLGMAPGTDRTPIEAVPARRSDLAGLPPTFIGVGSIDLFVDEDIAYANRLIDAGVPTELVVVPGAFHGFDGIGASTNVAKAFTAQKLAALKRAFA